MIEIKNVIKRFENTAVLNGVTSTINEGSIYGLIGANGAGKSTLLRLLAGVYKADEGEILIDGESVYENPLAKEKLHYVSDELYFLPGANLLRMAKMYSNYFKSFSMEHFSKLVEHLKLDAQKPLNTFSKGMRRQAAIVLALSTRPKYLFLDETFDGLDPVMRNTVKNLFVDEVLENKTTIILTSHSLRELEDTCDQLSLLHKGGIVFEKDVQDIKSDMFKVQIAFDHDFSKDLFKELELLSFKKSGSIATFIVRGDKDDTLPRLKALEPILLEALPLTLEEVFIHETSKLGYSFSEVE
ncbi:MAG: ABC transporter ATP-binding protein [Clostridia bacterium]|nr:ABC transporter ATP-binding protein [Clostridia bacterium]